MHDATKLVIITESILLDRIADLLLAKGATGYTHVRAGGKGSRGKRSGHLGSPSGLDANVKIEVIVADHAMAEDIADAVASAFFENYSGITYLEPVEILRPHKFAVSAHEEA